MEGTIPTTELISGQVARLVLVGELLATSSPVAPSRRLRILNAESPRRRRRGGHMRVRPSSARTWRPGGGPSGSVSGSVGSAWKVRAGGGRKCRNRGCGRRRSREERHEGRVGAGFEGELWGCGAMYGFF